MKYRVDEKSRKFSYIQLYEQLRLDIEKGVIPFGKKLPSKRLMADETGVSVITVEHAYSILADEGYIEPRERSGYFVIYREKDFITSASAQIKTVTKAKNQPKVKHTFPFSVLSKTMRKVLAEYGEEILVKSPNKGCYELRAAISSYLERSNGMRAEPSQIIIGSGSEYLYNLIVQLLGVGRTFAIEDPSYEKIYEVYNVNGVKCDKLTLASDGVESEELNRTKASVLHVTPFNSFPSGVTASISKRREYIRWADKKNGYIIEDNYDSELTVSKKNEDTLFSMSERERVIYLNTFSETIAPSMRVGYMVIPKKLMEVFERKLGFLSCTVPVFDQYVLAELINSGDFERHINRIRRERRKVR